MCVRIIGALSLALVCGLGIGADPVAATPVARPESVAMAPLPPSEAGDAVVTLSTALAALLGGNADVKVLEGNLQSAKAQHALNLSRNLPTLSGSGALSLTDGFNDQTQAIKAGATGLGIGGSLSGSLNYVQGAASTTSGTRIGLSVTHSNPYSPLSSGTAKISQAPSTAAALSLSQVVWDGYPGGQSKAILDKSGLTLQKSELATRQGRSSASAKLKQAYVTTLAAQRTLALRLAILERQNGLLRQIEATYALKQASAIDLTTARINARSAALDAETSRHDFSLARRRLANLMGLAADADFRVAEIDSPSLPATSLEEALAKGLASRADIAQLDLTRRSSEIDAALARGASQPTVTATGGLGLSYNWGADGASGVSPTTIAASNGESVSLGLRVSLPILDAGAARAQESVATASVAIATIQAAQLADSVGADIRDYWWSAAILGDKIELAKQSLELAEAQLALVKQQVQFGTATNQDLLTAAVNAANAEAAWLKSKSDQLLAVLSLETAMGL